MKNIIIFFFVLLFSITSFGKIRAPFARPMGFALEILKGNVRGHSLRTITGSNPAVGTTTETVWAEGGVVVFPSATTTMTVSSLDVDDTSAGTGLKTIKITGLSSGVELTETITLNGQTAVTTANTYERINSLEGVTAGSTGANEGIVYIGTGTVTAGKPAVVVNLVNVGKNLSDSGFFTVPLNHTGYLFQLFASSEGNKVINLEVFSRKLGGLFLLNAEYNLFNAALLISAIAPPQTIEARGDIEFRSQVGAGSADIKINFVLLLVDESVL